MASAQTFHEGEICSHCWRTMPELSEPRALPCGHVSCTECLEVKYKVHKGVRCETCKTVEEGLEVQTLPAAIFTKSELPTPVTCDKPACDKQAFHFCTNCEEKICNDDRKLHDRYFRDGHKVISLKEFEETAGKYKKSYCKHHKKELLIKACENCKKLICNQCDRSEGECSGPDTSHRYTELFKTADKITTVLKSLLAAAAQQTGEFQEADKKSWSQLEETEKECDTWMQEVEKTRHEHVKLLNEAYDKIQQGIQEVKTEANSKVVQYNNKLIQQRESLDVSRKSVHKLVVGGSSEEIILQEREVKEALTQQVQAELPPLPLDDKYALVPMEFQATPNIELIKLPSALSFSSEHPTDSFCYSACHRRDGDVLLGCTDGVKLLNKETMMISTYDLPYEKVHTVIEHNHNVYILHKHETTQKVEMLPPDMKHGETLFEFENPTKYVDFMAVSDKYIVAYRPLYKSKRDLIIYDFISKKMKYQHVEEVHKPSFLKNGDLLTACANQVKLYQIKDAVAVHCWSSQKLPNVCYLCCSSSGQIYVSTGGNKKTVHIIHFSGKKLQELTHDKLPGSDTGQISIRGNELVLPSLQEKRICIFKINQQ